MINRIVKRRLLYTWRWWRWQRQRRAARAYLRANDERVVARALWTQPSFTPTRTGAPGPQKLRSK
ncbi:MAG: hypothetical protein L0332_23520 [Chloroflexi bacterium]|nr:hypothetical protein [Chloroflexota bacterium]